MNARRIPGAWATFLAIGLLARSSLAAEISSTAEIARDAATGQLYVALPAEAALAQIDPATGKVVRKLPCPSAPHGLCLFNEGRQIAVACGGSQGLVALFDLSTGQITSTIGVGHTPRSPVVTPDQQRLFVCNQFGNDLSVIDLATSRVLRRVPLPREPVAAAITPDGSTLVVTNLLPAQAATSPHVAAEVSLVDLANFDVRPVLLPNGSTAARAVCTMPDGKLALVVHVLSRFNLPTSQVERGWMNTNALSLIDLDKAAVRATVLLDDIDRGAANPAAVAVSADGARIWISHQGTHELALIDAPALLARLEPGTSSSSSPINPANDLAFLAGIKTRIPLTRTSTGQPLLRAPASIALASADTAYVGLRYGNALASVQFTPDSPPRVTRIELGPEPSWAPSERGEILFNDATQCFQGWQSCATCHPDGRVDALNWDLLNDALGNPKNTKSFLLADQTPPSMFLGVRSNSQAAVRAGFHHILFAEVAEPDAQAVDAYLNAMKPQSSPYLKDGDLSESARRGQALFEPGNLGCASCHPAPLFTDLKMHDVGSRSRQDRNDKFDTPTLVEIWRTAPYLHDGRFATLEALFREGKHGDVEGSVTRLDESSLADLIAYLQSL